MNIIVGGMRRCGSTLCYNIIRMLYLENKFNVKGFLWDKEDMDMSFDHSAYDVRVMKRHNIPFTDLIKWSDKIFVPIRDLRDVIASDIKFGHFERNEYEILKACAFNVNMFNFWKKYAALICVYEEWVNSPDLFINKICTALELSIPDINDFINEINIYSSTEVLKPQSGFEKDSLLFANHISGKVAGGYKSFLTSDEIALIEDNFKEFLIQNNYTIGY